MNNNVPLSPDAGRLLYKLVVQFLIFSRGQHKLLEPHLHQISKRLKNGANLNELTPELYAISKTLLHIAKQDEQDATEQNDYRLGNSLLLKIDEILASTPVPIRFQQQKASLRRRVKSEQHDQSFNQIIDSAVTLLLDINTYISTEQSDIDSFLSGLTTQLNEIEQQAEQVGESTRLSYDHREELNSEINSRLDNIKNHTIQAEELLPLKSLTSDHLERLMSRLLTYKQQEDHRQQQAQQQIASMTIKLQALETETEALRNRLRVEHDRALCDALTGLPNRLAYKDRAEMETNRWQRYRSPLSLIIWDIDFFKCINDNYGHKAGDKTLALIGLLLRDNCRASDFVARYGGEEFVMLLPNTTASQAIEMADNVRLTIERCGFNHNGENINLTISCGISEFHAEDQYDDVFVRADRALYRAKQAGRNRCEVYSAEIDNNSQGCSES